MYASAYIVTYKHTCVRIHTDIDTHAQMNTHMYTQTHINIYKDIIIPHTQDNNYVSKYKHS